MSLQEQHKVHRVKRRLNDEESEGDREATLRRKVHHTLKELCKVVKKARAFEIQKTLKRLKETRRKDPESDVIKDLGVQLQVLKRLSCSQLAHSALMTKLRKDKTLSADPSIQTILAGLASNSICPAVPGTPTAKVQSRVLSSKILASEVVSTMETLRMFLQFSMRSKDTGEVTYSHHVSPDISKRRRMMTGHEKDAFSSGDGVANPSGEGKGRGYENTRGDEVRAEADDDWESGTVGASSVARSVGDHDTSIDDFNAVASERGSESSGTPRNKTPQHHGPKGQSEFLPSLSVGFTGGDSGSEISDREAQLVDGIKKNRRGQRARRAIWEKKFGKNANHIKKRQPQEVVRESKRHIPDSVRVDPRPEDGDDTSWRPPRTPTRAPARRVRRPPRDVGLARGESERRRAVLRGNPGDQPLHPSWEAKRKQKAASIVPSQGTKIVFAES